MHIMYMSCSIAEAVSSGSWPILFKVLTLNVAIFIVLLHICNFCFCLSSVADLGIAKNYQRITLTSIAAKIYNALQRNRIEPKIEKILRKNQNGFRRNKSTTSQFLTIRRILEGVHAKHFEATIFVDFTKAFDSKD